MEEPRSENVGVRTTKTIRDRMEQEARERRWTLSDIGHFALEQRYGLTPQTDQAQPEPPSAA